MLLQIYKFICWHIQFVVDYSLRALRIILKGYTNCVEMYLIGKKRRGRACNVFIYILDED